MTYPRALALGPFAFKGIWRKLLVAILIALITVLTQVGAPFAWLAAGAIAVERSRPRRWLGVPIIALALYGFASVTLVPAIARADGRVALSCFDRDAAIAPYSVMFCFANRHYVTVELAEVLTDLDATLKARMPGQRALFLDAGFPFGRGFPMLPHLSHADGRRIDFAFFYRAANGQPANRNGSPIGYFAFVPPPAGVRAACTASFPTLRWNLRWLQPLLNRPALDDAATRTLVAVMVSHPRIGKIFIEPHLQRRLGLNSAKVRFQGCRAARHDDHLHVQL